MPMAFDPSMISQFARTEHFHPLNRRCLITGGSTYLADEAGAYWLLDAAASYLLEVGTYEWFVLVRLVVKENQAVLFLEDGNRHICASQQIPFTDFPLPEQVLYACWDGAHWVLMFPSEY